MKELINEQMNKSVYREIMSKKVEINERMKEK